MNYFTSDTHFWHRNVIKYCDRPFSSVEEMNETIISNYNSRVTATDTCYFVGDIFFCSKSYARDIMSQLNGNKILIMGNHDGSKTKMLDLGFNEVHELLELNLGGFPVLLNHYPWFMPPIEAGGYSMRYGQQEYREGTFLIHGHCHSKPHARFRKNSLDIGVDGNNFMPYSETELVATIRAIYDDNA